MSNPLLSCFDFFLIICLKMWSGTCCTSAICNMILIKKHLPRTSALFPSMVTWVLVLFQYLRMGSSSVNIEVLAILLSNTSLLLSWEFLSSLCFMDSVLYPFLFLLEDFPAFIFRFHDKSKFHLEFIDLSQWFNFLSCSPGAGI